MAQALLDRFGGEVPTELDDLVTLPGVGRKTGNVVRSVAFGLPGLPVDTHVGRLVEATGAQHARRSGEARARARRLPAAGRAGVTFSLRMILHGRRVCDAKRPRLRRVRAGGHLSVVALPRRPRRASRT